MGDFRKAGYSGTMIFDPCAKRRTGCPPEVEEKNYRNAFTMYCSSCMEKYGLQEGKLANKRVGKCGICGADGFLVGNISADDGRIFNAKLQNNADLTIDKFVPKNVEGEL
jgi:hypothetical protein